MSLIAVDIGNSRVKLGVFARETPDALPTPEATLSLDMRRDDFETLLGDWLAARELAAARWRVASVNRPTRRRLAAWLAEHRPDDAARQLTYRDLPLKIEPREPERVGIDRLLGAVAANRLREAGQAAVVVDLGSAVTVDLVSPSGAFAGGAILPGVAMSARALHAQTDLLPDIALSDLREPPPALGASTEEAIRAGLYWGAVGAARELIARLTADADRPPLVLLTGGAAPSVAKLLGADARYLPHLVLSGIAAAAEGDFISHRDHGEHGEKG